eukprot:TRINITY_DN3292_c0_g1_i1.p1 TRINITY_DN3292_c0_g1~~TRINITY_DN3292_c0_g1_i1.p1  ORF type:complete len:232 (+),score=65.31 TRINITY_DN3292_c0_g1_i1:57-698(+)
MYSAGFLIHILCASIGISIIYCAIFVKNFGPRRHIFKGYSIAQCFGMLILLGGTWGIFYWNFERPDSKLQKWKNLHYLLGHSLLGLAILTCISGGLHRYFLNYYKHEENHQWSQPFWYELFTAWSGRLVLAFGFPFAFLSGFFALDWFSTKLIVGWGIAVVFGFMIYIGACFWKRRLLKYSKKKMRSRIGSSIESEDLLNHHYRQGIALEEEY